MTIVTFARFGRAPDRGGLRGRSVLERPTALARLQEGLRPDVIVLDIMMPAMDGLTFRSLQRKHADLADIPVVGLTAFPPSDADFECLTQAGPLRAPRRQDRRLARAAELKTRPGGRP